MNLKCVFGHKFTEYMFIKNINNIEDELKRKCTKCGKIDIYIGMTEKCITANKLYPYIFKE